MNDVVEEIGKLPLGDSVIVRRGTYMSIIGHFLDNNQYSPVKSPKRFKLPVEAQGTVLNPITIPNLTNGDVAVGVSQSLSTTVISLQEDTLVTHIQNN